MADNIILLYTDDEEKDKTIPFVHCHLAKQRAGTTGEFDLKFMKSINRFVGIEGGAK